MKNIVLLGSTGSIGTQTLELVRQDPDIHISALAVETSIEALAGQIEEFRPDCVCVFDSGKADGLRQNLKGAGYFPEIVSGIEGLEYCAAFENADLVIVAVVGMIGIRAVIAAAKAGKNIALANKESLVTAGHIIMPLIREKNVSLIPVDSEHCAIYQCLEGEKHSHIRKLILTASGGPFRNFPADKMRSITAADALKHPNWSMGAKITIDSATMINKALEVIEAHFLFDIPVDDISILIQPQSVIHSAVEFIDGSIKAQLGIPDMSLPISYALYYPQRKKMPEDKMLDLLAMSSIELARPDYEKFPGLRCGIEAAKAGGSMRTVFCAADEEAVAAFLNGRIGFSDIHDGIRSAMDAHKLISNPDLSEIFEAEREARRHIRRLFSIDD